MRIHVDTLRRLLQLFLVAHVDPCLQSLMLVCKHIPSALIQGLLVMHIWYIEVPLYSGNA
jgi:hypothetical protein